MARASTIGVSLTAQELKLVRQQVKQGSYESESDVIRDSLRRMFHPDRASSVSSGKNRSSPQRLAAAYRAMATHDRKLAREWSSLDDSWPNR
jgi:putative addiction module CopG family antidote